MSLTCDIKVNTASFYRAIASMQRVPQSLQKLKLIMEGQGFRRLGYDYGEETMKLSDLNARARLFRMGVK